MPRHLPLMPFLLAILVPGAGLAADSRLVQLEPAQRDAAGIRVEAVQAASAGKASAETAGLKLPGRVVLPNAQQDLVLANVAGRVEAVLVNAGGVVRAGQALLRLHSAELLALQRGYLGAQAQATLAGQRVTRDESLHSDGVIPASRLEATRADALQSQAALREQRQLLRLAGMSDSAIAALRAAEDMTPLLTVTARRPGRVLSLDVRAGERVELGAPLASVASLDEFWIDLQATREQARQLSTGDVALLPGCEVRGTVVAAGVQLEETSQTTTARARFLGAGHCVAPNQFVQVGIAPAKAPSGVVLVPATALLHYAGKDAVFVEDPGGYRLVDVKIVRYQGSVAWLQPDGVQGRRVVIAGVAALKGRWQGLGAGAGVKGTD
jgi:multidrug efflux pump subunit AcrA (membrane-fusion protein)